MITMLKRLRLVMGWQWVVSALLFVAPAHAQDAYPSKLIRIVTAAPGSNNDWGARLVAQELTPRLGQQVIVENRGSLGVEVVAKAPPDGHTLLFYCSTARWRGYSRF